MQQETIDATSPNVVNTSKTFSSVGVNGYYKKKKMIR